MPDLVLAAGHRIAYRRLTGATPGILFLGGFHSAMSGSKARWLERWCRERQRAYICFDYRGHGLSSARFEDGTIGAWRDDALAVIDRLSEGPQVLVGSSMGAWLMLLAALARPARIAGLLGVACAADFTADLTHRLDSAQRRTLEKDGVLYLPSEYSEQPYPITQKLLEESRRHRLLDAPIALSCPVHLLHGMRDADVPWQTSLRVAESLQGENVRLTLVKDGEHRLSRTQDLRLLTALLSELLDELSASA